MSFFTDTPPENFLEYETSPIFVCKPNPKNNLYNNWHSRKDKQKKVWKLPKGIILKHNLAFGSFGIVATGTIQVKEKKVDVCVKRSIDFAESETDAKSFLLEMMIARNTKHVNLVRIYTHVWDGENEALMLVMPKGLMDLRTAVTKRKFTNFYRDFFADMVQGVHYLHHNGLVHRDLCPSNILIFGGNRRPHVKLTDFGIACFDGQPTDRKIVTTYPYRAPEIFCQQNLTSPEMDIWSLGAIYFKLIQKRAPFRYGRESLVKTTEWKIFARQCSMLIPREEMNLKSQDWIRTEVGKKLFEKVSAYFQPKESALVKQNKLCDLQCELLRQVLVMDPARRPNIDEVAELFGVPVPSGYESIKIDRHEFLALKTVEDVVEKLENIEAAKNSRMKLVHKNAPTKYIGTYFPFLRFRLF